MTDYPKWYIEEPLSFNKYFQNSTSSGKPSVRNKYRLSVKTSDASVPLTLVPFIGHIPTSDIIQEKYDNFSPSIDGGRGVPSDCGGSWVRTISYHIQSGLLWSRKLVGMVWDLLYLFFCFFPCLQVLATRGLVLVSFTVGMKILSLNLLAPIPVASGHADGHFP
jgi:hypothetical protein